MKLHRSLTSSSDGIIRGMFEDYGPRVPKHHPKLTRYRAYVVASEASSSLAAVYGFWNPRAHKCWLLHMYAILLFPSSKGGPCLMPPSIKSSFLWNPEGTLFRGVHD